MYSKRSIILTLLSFLPLSMPYSPMFMNFCIVLLYNGFDQSVTMNTNYPVELSGLLSDSLGSRMLVSVMFKINQGIRSKSSRYMLAQLENITECSLRHCQTPVYCCEGPWNWQLFMTQWWVRLLISIRGRTKFLQPFDALNTQDIL